MIDVLLGLSLILNLFLFWKVSRLQGFRYATEKDAVRAVLRPIHWTIKTVVPYSTGISAFGVPPAGPFVEGMVIAHGKDHTFIYPKVTLTAKDGVLTPQTKEYKRQGFFTVPFKKVKQLSEQDKQNLDQEIQEYFGAPPLAQGTERSKLQATYRFEGIGYPWEDQDTFSLEHIENNNKNDPQLVQAIRALTVGGVLNWTLATEGGDPDTKITRLS